MVSFLNKENPTDFTFHSFRRTSATLAADSGATIQQMQDFFGWKSPSMTMEYITTSSAAVKSMASVLNSESDVGEDKMAELDISDKKAVVASDGDSDGQGQGSGIFENNHKVVVIYGGVSGTINI